MVDSTRREGDRASTCHPDRKHFALGLCQPCYGKQSRPKYPDAMYVKSRRASNLKRRYGITVEDYDSMLKAQGGKCLLCGKKPGRIRLAIDHDHLLEKKYGTVVINGLIHNRENFALGKFEYSNDVLTRLIEYVTLIINRRKQYEKEKSDV